MPDVSPDGPSPDGAPDGTTPDGATPDGTTPDGTASDGNPDGGTPVAWAAAGNSTGRAWAQAVAINARGEVAITGVFSGRVTFGSATLTGNGPSNIFVVKYASNGGVQWARQAAGSGVNHGYGVAIDGAGAVYAVGKISGTVTVTGGAPTTVTSNGSTDIFLVAYASNGTLRYARAFGASSTDHAYGVAMWGGLLAVTGFATGTVDFGSGPTLPTTAASDTFVAVFRTGDGAVRWVRRFPAPAGDYVAMSSSTVYVSGEFSGSKRFDTTTIVSAGGEDVFVVALSTTGALRWVKRIGGSGDDHAGGLAAGPQDITIAGDFTGLLSFGAPTHLSSGGSDVFLVSYTQDGALRWSAAFGGGADDRAYALAWAGTEVVAAGTFTGTMRIGTDSFGATATDSFVARVSTSGSINGGVRLGGPGLDVAFGAAASQSGTVICGYFEDRLDLGSRTLRSVGGADAFVIKLP